MPLLIMAYGALTLAAQVLLLREILVLCQGQELKLGLALWCWLTFTGLGSLAGKRLWRGRAMGGRTLAVLLAALAGLMVATLILLRALPILGLTAPGQAPGPGSTVVLLAALLAPLGLASGGFFPLACEAGRVRFGPKTGGRVYALEAWGAAWGVTLLQVLLWGQVSTLALGLGTAFLTVLLVLVLAPPRRWRGRLLGGLVLFSLGGALAFSGPLDLYTRKWQLPGRTLLAAVDSPYALLTASREAEQVSFAANGIWHSTWPDPATAEPAVQIALLAHPGPERVLLLGGALDWAAQILKTKTVARLDYVEADPELLRLSTRLLPPAATKPLQAPQVRVVQADARLFLQRSQENYDVILMALPAPKSAQLNRFYSQEFFAAVARRLAPGGIFTFSLPGAPATLSPLRAAYLRSMAATLALIFPEVLVLPGETVRFLASPTKGALRADPSLWAARLAARHLELSFITPHTLVTEFSQERQTLLASAFREVEAQVNTDLRPRGFFFELALAGSLEGVGLGRMLAALQAAPIWVLTLGGMALVVLLAGLVRRRPGVHRYLQVALVGAGVIALELLGLLVYQIYLGNLYRQLGLLIAACMLGMAAGGTWGSRPSQGASRLLALQAGQAILLVAAAGGLAHVSGGPSQEMWVSLGSLFLLWTGGFAGGGVFALAAVSPPGWGTAEAKEGTLYAADLLGATLGALGFSLMVLPAWGVVPALMGVAALHALAALLALMAGKQ